MSVANKTTLEILSLSPEEYAKRKVALITGEYEIGFPSRRCKTVVFALWCIDWTLKAYYLIIATHRYHWTRRFLSHRIPVR